jgi:hypothetical protein
VISDGFLKLESLNFWMTPSPKHSLQKKAPEKAGVEFRCRALTISTRLNAFQHSSSTPLNAVQHPASTEFNARKLHRRHYPV